MNRLTAVALALCSAACLKLFRSPERYESVLYGKLRGTVAFTSDYLPYTAENQHGPAKLMESSDLSDAIIAKGFLPEPFGKARYEKPCETTRIPELGSYAVAEFVTVELDGVETIVYLDPVISPHADKLVEVESLIFRQAPLGFPSDGGDPPYQFAMHVLPRLQPGLNLLVITAGIRCASDPINSVQVESELEVTVDADRLAKTRAALGPFVQVPRQSSLRDLIPMVTAQIELLVPDYTPLVVEPLDRTWVIAKDAFDLPLSRDFYAVLIARRTPSGGCFGNTVIVRSDFDGTGYAPPVVELVSPIWSPFPCENTELRADYTPPPGR